MRLVGRRSDSVLIAPLVSILYLMPPAPPVPPRGLARGRRGGARLPGDRQHRARQDLARRARGRRALGAGAAQRRRRRRYRAGRRGRRAGVRAGDVLLSIDGQEVRTVADVATALHAADGRRVFCYVVQRVGRGLNRSRAAAADAAVAHGLYYSLALVGILVDRRRRVGAAAAAERSGDAALLLADGRVLRRARVHAERAATTSSTTSSTGRTWSRGSRCRRCSCTSRSSFPSGRIRGSRDRSGRARAAAALSAGGRCSAAAASTLVAGGLHGARVVARARADRAAATTRISAVCLLGGLLLMMRALAPAAIGHRAAAAALDRLGIGGRRRAVRARCTSCRCSSGACRRTPSTRRCCSAAFRWRSPRRIVRYRLMDIEVIIKKALVVAAVVLRAGRDLRRHAAARRPRARRGRRTQQLLGAPRDARRRARRAVAVEGDSGGARSALLPRSLRLPPRARRASRAS